MITKRSSRWPPGLTNGRPLSASVRSMCSSCMDLKHVKRCSDSDWLYWLTYHFFLKVDRSAVLLTSVLLVLSFNISTQIIVVVKTKKYFELTSRLYIVQKKRQLSPKFCTVTYSHKEEKSKCAKNLEGHLCPIL